MNLRLDQENIMQSKNSNGDLWVNKHAIEKLLNFKNHFKWAAAWEMF